MKLPNLNTTLIGSFAWSERSTLSIEIFSIDYRDLVSTANIYRITLTHKILLRLITIVQVVKGSDNRLSSTWYSSASHETVRASNVNKADLEGQGWAWRHRDPWADLAAAGSTLTAALAQASHSQPLIMLSVSFSSKTAGIRRSSYQIIVCFLVSIHLRVQVI